MKKLLLILLVLSLNSCEQQEAGQEQVAIREIDISQIRNRDGIAYAVNEEKPFSGKATSFHPNGQLESEASFVNGKPAGAIRSWYENGQLSKEIHAVNGEVDGVSRKWYQDGQLWIEQTYVNGKLDGVSRAWSENGQLIFEKTYANGKAIK